MGVDEGSADAVPPRLVVAGMVDLVEDHEPVRTESRQLRCGGSSRHLLVGRDEPVDVAGQSVAG